MQKFLVGTLTVLIAFSASVQSAAASNHNATEQVPNLKLQSDNLPPYTVNEAKADNNRKVESEVAARSEAAFTPSPIEPGAVNHTENIGVAVEPNAAQATPTSTQKQPAHHSHHVRNLIIFTVVLFAGLFLLVVAAGKS